MALDIKLDVKLTQKLVLTPQLQQAIKLLQLPQLELAQAINQELEVNPFLEEIPKEESEEVTEAEQADSEEEDPLPLEKLTTFRIDDYFEERGSDGRDLGYFNPGIEERPSFENFLRSPTSLYDHLLWQLNMMNIPAEIRQVAEAIVGNLDENGYFRLPLEEIARICNTDLKTVEEALRVVQDLDPPGIGARDLKECLLLQIRQSGLQGTLVERIVQNNLKDLERKDYQAIAKMYDATVDDIRVAVDLICQLDPKPARNFSGHETNYIVPDVFVEKTEEGYRIILNDDGLPRLKLNNFYRKMLTCETLSKEEKKFLREKLRSALWLIKSLDQRQRTIYKVTESILKFQREFFDKGPQYIRPLNLREVAQDINMHESTVSRVTLNKYLACSHGIFSFKYFFSSAVRSDNGDVSSRMVKEKIKRIIERENPFKPYSDQQIANILKEENIEIARRTVAKYREEMGIPSQSKRKKRTP